MHWSRCALSAAFIALLVPSAQVTASEFSSSSKDLLSRFDTNQDGKVDQIEYVSYMGLGFTARDLDDNGVLEGDEIPPRAKVLSRHTHEETLARQFKRQDINGDGFLSAAELMAPPRG